MRTAIAAVLALVAVAAAGMWGLAQFGSPKPMVAVEREPVARVEASASSGAAAAPLANPPQHEPGAAHPNAPDTLKADKSRAVAEAGPAPKPAVAAPAPTSAPAAEPAPIEAAPAASETKPADALKAAVAAEAKKALGKELKGLAPQATPSLPPGFASAPPPEPTPPPPPAATPTPPSPGAVIAPSPALPPPPPRSDDLVQTANAPAPASAKSAAPAPVPAAAAAAAVSLAEQFKTRKVAYNRPPPVLYLDRPIDISLVIDATAAADPAAQLQGFPGEIVKRDVDLSDTVSAQLTGVGFDIVSQTVARQTLSAKLPNRWQWRVTPTEPGARTLMLDIFGYKAGSLDAEPLDAYRDQITVEVRQLDSVIKWAKGIQPLFAVVAAIAGLLSALIAFLRFRRDGKKPG